MTNGYPQWITDGLDSEQLAAREVSKQLHLWGGNKEKEYSKSWLY